MAAALKKNVFNNRDKRKKDPDSLKKEIEQLILLRNADQSN